MVAMYCSYYALARIELADFTALSFTKPLFATVLAVIILGEVVRWRRWSATIVGFVGVLIMMRPGTGTFQTAGFFALGDAFSIALLITLVKRLPARETPLGMLFYFGVIASRCRCPAPSTPGAMPVAGGVGAAAADRRAGGGVAILLDPRLPLRRRVPGRCVRLSPAAVGRRLSA